MRRRLAACRLFAAMLAGVGLTLVAGAASRAQSLVADLSHHLVAITTGFTGTDVVLFGAVDQPGDVAVVVSGPRGPARIWRKERVGGIWINRTSQSFDQVPAYYAVATSRPLAEAVKPAVLARHQIGFDHLTLRPVISSGGSDDPRPFRESLIRNMVERGLYRAGVGDVQFLGERLFRTTISFPANVPIGIYTVGVFLIRDGDVASAQTTPLSVGKVGLSAEIFSFAQSYPVLYGLGAIAGAVLIGWLAGAVFRE